MTKRKYDNSKRERESGARRERIVEAMVSSMAEGAEDVSVADVAELAEVSRRTVYQYFPDRDARKQAINDWIDSRASIDGVLPTSYADIPAYAERLVDYIFANETMLRAQMAAGLSKEVRSYRKRKHARFLKKALGELIADPEIVDDATALILSTLRTEAVFDMRDLYGLSQSRTKRQFRLLVEAVLDAFEAKAGQAVSAK